MKMIPRLLLVLANTISFAADSNEIKYENQNFSEFNWSPIEFYEEAYIDYTRIKGDKIKGFTLPIMVVYESISSAQMWGLSEIDLIRINCAKGHFQYLNTVWTEEQYGMGKIEYAEEHTNNKPTSILKLLDESFERKLFNHVCK